MKKSRNLAVWGLCALFLGWSVPAVSSVQLDEDLLDEDSSSEGGMAFYEVDLSIYYCPQDIGQGVERFSVGVNFPQENKQVDVEFSIEPSNAETFKFLMLPGDNPGLDIEESLVGDGFFGNVYCNLEGGYLTVPLENPVSIMKIFGNDALPFCVKWNFLPAEIVPVDRGVEFCIARQEVKPLPGPNSMAVHPDGFVSLTFPGGEVWENYAFVPRVQFQQAPAFQ